MNMKLIAIVAVVGLVVYFLFKGQTASTTIQPHAATSTGDDVSALFGGITSTPTGVPIASGSPIDRVALPGSAFGPINPYPLPGPAQPVRIFQAPTVPVPVAAPASKYVPPPVVLNKLFFSAGGGLG